MIIDIVLVFAEGRGGLEDVITSVSQGLVKKGHRVRVFQSYKPKYIEWVETIPEIYYYGENENLENEDINSLSKGYEKLLKIHGKPDVVLATHAPSLSYICRIAISRIEGPMPPIISWLHGPPEYFGNEELLRYSDAHLAISTDIGNSIKKNIYDGIPVYYIGNPVYLDNIKGIRQTQNPLKIVYIGRLHIHDKRLDILFKSLVNLKFEWELICIGEGSDEKNLKILSAELGIENNIKWLGWKDNPWEYITDATVLTLTSDYEGFGLVLVEALARGIPVISTSCSGPIDIIQDEINGWLFPIGDYNYLNNLLNEIGSGMKMLPSPEVCKQSVEKFNYSNILDNIESIINYHYQLERIDKENDISNFIIKDNLYLNTEIIGDLLDITIKGIEYLGSTEDKKSIDNLVKYFSIDFLNELKLQDTENKEEKVNAMVCYPKVKLIDYKISKAIVSFLLINEGIEKGKIFKEKLKCETKLRNEKGKWKIDSINIIGENNKEVQMNKSFSDKRKILLVTTNNSGSNTLALYKKTPEYIKNRCSIELVKQELTDEYLEKIKEADVLIITEGNVLLDKNLYNPDQIIIDLWHSFTLKAIGYLDKNETNKNTIADRVRNIDFLCSYSSMYNELMRECYQVDSDVFKITGVPRNDLLLESFYNGNREIFSRLFRKEFGDDKKVIFYMPTYRQVSFSNRTDTTLKRDNIFGFSKYDHEEMECFLKRYNIELVVKLHPAEETLFLNKVKSSNNIHLLTNEMLTKRNIDLYEILGMSDGLITDYSSVYFDYLLIDKPIIFLPIDLEDYLSNRGIILDYNMWTPGPKVRTQKELQESIIRELNQNCQYIEDRKRIREKVHKYEDSLASKRIWEFINCLLN